LNPREQGFLLLTSHLGNPDRKPLTVPQLRTLTQRIRNFHFSGEDRSLRQDDIVALGYGRDMAARIVGLLSETQLLEYYCSQGAKHGCVPITRVTDAYPLVLRQKLGLDSPGCLWAKGETGLLNTPMVSLVGSRELNPENREFAAEVGRQAARAGLTLVSGNARGADRMAQNACLEAGGRVISVVADELCSHTATENVLYLSEDGFDDPFSAQRALSRNRCIHALGSLVFVAQAEQGRGGTWDGTVRNLRYGWSTVACFRDGSETSRELEQLGAFLIGCEDLSDFGSLSQMEMKLF